jgi:hypothetical protein
MPAMTAFTRKIALAAALSAAIIPAVTLGQEVGITAVVRNDVKVTTPANPTLHKAIPRERIALGNDIVTGGSSMTQLLLLDKTSFTVGANARVRIDRFVYDPARNASSVSTSVAKGAFRFMSGRALKNGSEGSTIKTPVASIGIRGTIVEGAVGKEAIEIARREGVIDRNTIADPETASLIVLRGPGRNAQSVQRGAIDVTVGDQVIPLEDAGMALFIPGPGQAPIGPFMLSQRGVGALRDLLGVRPIPGRERTFERDPTTDQQFGCDGGGQSGDRGCVAFD